MCEGTNCDKREGRDLPKLSRCTRCQIALYCSRDCLRGDWPKHKLACCAPGQREHMLPSQRVVHTDVLRDMIRRLLADIEYGLYVGFPPTSGRAYFI
ncbi:hypothetical protein OE88DRAFT_1727698 [Heliocybe sulcata]|uniref:MYND-type domain-containing protein n=1 Tax=Heliocybe sulcata TaxID=5364 RepID=A0A5C3N3N1_9AGAM|nr:hypothetical protein OE88DRAFT_1727698 [Heliocybe sulcata]